MIGNKTTTSVPIYCLKNVILNTSARMSSSSNYKHAKTGPFTQAAPVLENPFTSDPILSRALKRLLPQQEYSKVSKDLTKFGDRIVNEVDKLAYEAEIQPPQIQQFDAWGNRVDKLIVAPAWNRLKEISAEEGLIAIGYDNSVDPEYRRLHQMSKLYMFHPSSGLVSCPLAMTDGAAKTIQELKLGDKFPECKEAFERLTSRDPKKAWTSGQWMTEKGGGSDVGGGCDTYAEKVDGNNYNLFGYKWFSSAVDADMSLTLARSVENGQTQTGSRGLSLFYLRVRDSKDGPLNGLQMMRLKNKLGTKQLPTAELLLDGVKAIKLSEEGRGVPSIANMLNITRVHNAIASASGMRRILSLARDYSTRREAFGNTLYKWPLHVKLLAQLEIQTRAALLFTLESTRLLGKQESGRASEEDSLLLRLITPIVKLHTGKICVPAISEGIECFGGQGYIEDTGLPGILRDTQVTAIWEGTTNVLSLDVLRVFATTNLAAYKAYVSRIQGIISKAKNGDEKLQKSAEALESALNQVNKILKSAQKETLQRGARDLAMSMGNIYSGALLTEFASHSDATANDKEVAYRYCLNQKLAIVDEESFNASNNSIESSIVFENYSASKL